ncbi:MAG: RNA-guided endonuclease IscB [Clostridiales bacterium]|nr:RNA-guided endonuclease IscB [Clostridiales bacterium]
MKVFVIGQNGIGLMPTTPRKARKLLKAGKADVAQMNPFTIRLNYKTGSATQDITFGIDTGEQHIGFAVISGDTVQYKSEVDLRKSMEKRKLLEKRKEYRRNRRYRKVRYRHPKYKAHRIRMYSEKPDKKGRHWHTAKRPYTSNRQKGWLPPSIQSKVDHHINWIRKFQKALPKRTVTRIEVARFDIQHMMDPTIRGKEYQHGRMYGYENTKAYVLAKFNYKCAVCGHAFDHEHRARLHHLTYKSKGATDNPDEMAPVCEKCHTPDNHYPDQVLDKMRRACKRKEYREPTFMNILRRRLFQAFPDAEFTYGNMTKADRETLGLEKTHANDAVAVAMKGKDSVHDLDHTVYIQQVRRKKRSLHEAKPRKGRKEPNRKAVRNKKNTKQVKGFHIWDTVLYKGQVSYITGFSGDDDAYIKDFDGNYILPDSKKYKQISLSQLKLIQVRTNNYVALVR